MNSNFPRNFYAKMFCACADDLFRISCARVVDQIKKPSQIKEKTLHFHGKKKNKRDIMTKSSWAWTIKQKARDDSMFFVSRDGVSKGNFARSTRVSTFGRSRIQCGFKSHLFLVVTDKCRERRDTYVIRLLHFVTLDTLDYFDQLNARVRLRYDDKLSFFISSFFY